MVQKTNADILGILGCKVDTNRYTHSASASGYVDWNIIRSSAAQDLYESEFLAAFLCFCAPVVQLARFSSDPCGHSSRLSQVTSPKLSADRFQPVCDMISILLPNGIVCASLIPARSLCIRTHTLSYHTSSPRLCEWLALSYMLYRSRLHSMITAGGQLRRDMSGCMITRRRIQQCMHTRLIIESHTPSYIRSAMTLTRS